MESLETKGLGTRLDNKSLSLPNVASESLETKGLGTRLDNKGLSLPNVESLETKGLGTRQDKKVVPRPHPKMRKGPGHTCKNLRIPWF